MTISSPGIGSNLDVNGIIQKLMSVEQQPLTRVQQTEDSTKAKVSALGTIKSALASFQTSIQALSDISKFQTAKVTASDSSIITGTGGADAVTGTYSLEVTKLAQAQKLVSAGQANTTDSFSTGTISFDFGTIDTSGGTFNATTGKYTGATFTSSGSGTKTVTIDSSNNTLTGIRDAINAAKIGVTATIVNDGSNSPYRLVLTDSATGKASSMKITVSDPGTLQDLLQHDPANDTGQALSETVTAQNAEFKVDGIAASKSSNTVSDMIPGVTLNLLKTNSGTPATLTVDRDASALTTNINQFVTAYNQLRSKIDSATAYDATNKKASPLTGDATVRTIQFQLDNLLTSPITSTTNAFTQLSEIGVAKQKDGTLAVDSTKLQNAISSNYSSIATLFAAVGKPSDSQISYASSTSATTAGNYAVSVNALATKGTLVGNPGTPSSLTIDGTNDTINVLLDGATATLALTPGTYSSLDALAAEVQSKINGASAFSGSSVIVSTTGGVLTLTSNRYGSASSVNITGGSGQLNLIGAGAVATAGTDVDGTINGVAATGSGQFLTGATGDASEGLKLKVTGGATGARGTIDFSKGIAYQIDQLMNSILGDDGAIASATGSLNDSIQRLEDQKQRINDHLAIVEKQYRDQFTALDTLMGSMTTTSTFLTQQLSKLA